MGEGLGALHEEACAYAFGNRAHALLGALHEDGHLGDFLADEAAEVYAGIQFFIGRLVIPVKHETYVGDDSKEVLLVFPVQGHCVVVVCGHQDLWPCPLAEDLLVFVHRIQDSIGILLKDKLRLEQRRQLLEPQSRRVIISYSNSLMRVEMLFRGRM